MTLYLDSSVVLRIVFGQPDRLATPEEPHDLITSGLTEVECLRAIDRLRLSEGGLARVPQLRASVYVLLAESDTIEVTRGVLRRAGQSFATPLRTLDALHLSTALLWAEHTGAEPVMATHDRRLAAAARASGLRVVGVQAK